MNILVTGGAGFIGFHVVRALLARGDEVVVVDNLNDYYDTTLKRARLSALGEKIKFYSVDISDYDSLKIVFQENKIDKVCHLAAQAGVLPSIQNPFIYQKTNILGTLNILEAAKEHHVSQVVAASSSSVYGANETFPSSEEQRTDTPISLYAATKKSTEVIAHYYHHLFGLKVTMLRFFNVYGEWGRPDMMPWIFTENILLGKPINVNNRGDTWKDYTYIDDIAAGVLAALDHPYDYEIINLGNNTPEHLKHCIEIIEQVTGKKAIINLQPLQPGDVKKSCADITKAKRLLGWAPTTKMDVGLPKFIKWYQEYQQINHKINHQIKNG